MLIFSKSVSFLKRERERFRSIALLRSGSNVQRSWAFSRPFALTVSGRLQIKKGPKSLRNGQKGYESNQERWTVRNI